jgi:hypothetical protein
MHRMNRIGTRYEKEIVASISYLSSVYLILSILFIDVRFVLSVLASDASERRLDILLARAYPMAR